MAKQTAKKVYGEQCPFSLLSLSFAVLNHEFQVLPTTT